VKKSRTKQTILVVVVSFVALLHSMPLLIILMNALRTNEAVNQALIAFPTDPRFINIPEVWVKGGYLNGYVSSLMVGVGAVSLVLILITLAAYGIVKLDIFFRDFFVGYFVGALSIPMFGILIPLYFTFNSLGLANTRIGVMLIYSAIYIPFNFLFMRAFFIGIPTELEDAGRIDGCSELRTLWHITLPLARPIMTTVALIVFTFTWNEFLFANVFLSSHAIRTVSVRFFTFTSEWRSNYAYIYAASLITVVPILVLYVFMQNAFIEGMTKGSLKT
jgi:raffinose/stachyose/melibiose transport system permease protein